MYTAVCAPAPLANDMPNETEDDGAKGSRTLARLGCVSDGFGQLFPLERVTLISAWEADSYTNILRMVQV